MFELIIFEIADVMEPGTRWINWKIDIYLMLAILIGVLPLYLIAINVSSRCSTIKQSVVCTLACFGVFLYMFYKIGDPFPIVSEKKHGLLSIEHGVSRI